ncbi:MAG: hypoxanthine phosphoribosyltransferase [Gemmatimonadota bacterium]|nr:MAG: hypoxanthine phosphoribosyltransferase [Gemmatimonadota bacterium]
MWRRGIPVNGNVIPLISEDEIHGTVRELGRQISSEYDGKVLHVVGVLKGAWIFMADLVRRLTIPVKTDFIAVASYGSGTESSGTITLVSDLRDSIEGKEVLLVEDIVDTGLSLQFLLETLWERKPQSLKTCVLLDKPDRHAAEVNIDYLGMTVPDRFLVGYGLDYDEQFRNLPYIGYIELKNHID